MPSRGDQVAARLHLRLVRSLPAASCRLPPVAMLVRTVALPLVSATRVSDSSWLIYKAALTPSNRLIASALAKRSSICHLRF
ncbi:hypothetical protein [Xanthomonas sacchari]|uniref:hypothetical protein n=1 Tax=Xanthomonas sacchari TaxID=56458 RepID=UPI002257B6D5|nr:hypothetical protein [Xanthomonas sacchari]UYK72706.1 hypothetical protein NG828_21410 [Xanthomonas sacchari]